jgi:ATP/ADP translocase
MKIHASNNTIVKQDSRISDDELFYVVFGILSIIFILCGIVNYNLQKIKGKITPYCEN